MLLIVGCSANLCVKLCSPSGIGAFSPHDTDDNTIERKTNVLIIERLRMLYFDMKFRLVGSTCEIKSVPKIVIILELFILDIRFIDEDFSYYLSMCKVINRGVKP